MRYTDRMMTDGGGEADLQKTAEEAADVASKTSAGSYKKTIRLPLKTITNQYKFWFTYLYQDPDTQLIIESERSPVVTHSFDIPNLTLGVTGLTLTPGYKSYGVKFTVNPLSKHEDIVIFESLTSTSIGDVVYIGTSNSVTIQTDSIATRWITVRTRDKWKDANFTDTGPLSVTPLNPDPDTTYTVANPASIDAVASIDPKDLSGFSVVSNITWAKSVNAKAAGYSIRWSTTNPAEAGVTPLWEYASVSGIDTLSYNATGLIPNTTYYYQVASTTPYDTIDWSVVVTKTFIAADGDGTAAGALARLKSFIAIGGASQDLFKIGTGISQSINLNTDPLVSPTLTAGTYHGIILNKSTTNVGNNFWLTTGQFRVGNPTEFMYWNGTNLYLTGSINATGGKFTGNVKLDGGTLFAGAAADSGQRVRLNSSGIFAYNATSPDATFSLDTAGYMNAKSGLVGGWSIGADKLEANSVILNSAGQISLGSTPSTSVFLSSTDAARIWVGSQSSSTSKFKVMADGTLYATGAVFGDYASKTYADGIGNIAATDATTKADAAKAAAIAAAATDATTKANTAKDRADLAYDKAVAAAEGTTLAQQRAQEAIEAAALKMAASEINDVIGRSSTVINGDRVTTGTIDVARLNITGGNTTNGFAVDGNGIRGYSGGSQNLNISSSGVISMKGAITATSGKIAGFEIASNSDLYADTAVGPRILFQDYSTSNTIMHFGWESGAYRTGTYALIVGQDTTSTTSSFYVNTKTSTFRFAADSTTRAYAGEVRNGLRARDLYYITSLNGPSSSRRFKENISYAPERYYERILDIKPAFFKYVDQHPDMPTELSNVHAFGIIAEDLEEAGLGYFVQRNMNGEAQQLMNSHELAWLLIPIVKELKQEVAQLKSRLDSL
jgi:hypothetical protein